MKMKKGLGQMIEQVAMAAAGATLLIGDLKELAVLKKRALEEEIAAHQANARAGRAGQVYWEEAQRRGAEGSRDIVDGRRHEYDHMAGALQEKYPDVAARLHRIVECLDEAQAIHDEMRDVMHAEEWRSSGDYGSEAVAEAVEKWRASRPKPAPCDCGTCKSCVGM